MYILLEEGDCDQYWSAIEPVLVTNREQYWSPREGVLVAKAPEYGLFGGGCTSIYYWYRDERIGMSALAEGVLTLLMP